MRPYWQNPEIQQLNRLPMRSPLFSFDSTENAVTTAALGAEYCPQPKTPWYQSLDGSWDFFLLDRPDAQAPEAAVWKPIQVPGSWSLQGYDKPHYTNVQMPWSPVPPYTPEENPTGLYKKQLSIPASWKGRRIVLHVGSAESCLLVYLNGAFAGLSKDTRLPSEFDITDSISWSQTGGSAELLLKVVRYSDASFVEDQDQWWFGGLHRSIYLYSTEETYIADVEALTSVKTHHGTRCGTVTLTIPLGFRAESGAIPEKPVMDKLTRTVRYALYELNSFPDMPQCGAKLCEGSETAVYDYRATEAKVRASLTIDEPRLWSSEHPSLYLLSVSLYESENGRLIESTACTIGFKTVSIESRELRINGKKVYIHGVNRHEHNEYTGKTLTVKQMLYDILLLKQYNFNAVRTCHYPDDEAWYELCDRYGIYVLDEANIENHAYYDFMCRSDEWTGAYMQRVQRMYRRDKNHACIFGWSLGNESGAAQNHDAMAAWLHKVDSTRIVHYEGYSRPEFKQSAYTVESLERGRGVVDIISPMYPTIELIKKFSRTSSDSRPLIMCEYSHAMGNSNGSLSDYWEAIESHPGLQGGFIWDWIDQGIASTSADGKKYWKYGGDFGDEPTDYDFCLNGLLLPDQTPKPAMEECRALFAPVRIQALSAAQGKFIVENRFDFSSLDLLKIRWVLAGDRSVLTSGTLDLPAAAPGEKVQISLPIAEALAQAESESGSLSLTMEAVYTKTMPYAPEGATVTKAGFELACKKLPLPLTEAAGSSNAVTEIFTASRPQLFRALTENECIKARLNVIGTEAESHYFHCNATLEWLHSDLLHLELKGGELWTGKDAIGELQHKKLGSYCQKVTPLASPDGKSGASVDIRFTLTDALSEYPRVGITLPVSAAYKNAAWLGLGPQEAYSDRKAGAIFGHHALKASELETPYIVPQENGNRADVRHLILTADDGKKLHIYGETPFNFSLSRYSTEDLWKSRHTCDLTDTSAGKDGFFSLNLDIAVRGIGTASCGDDTLPQYRLYPGTYSLLLYVWEE
ncbi:MAG: DUF4981 domain-containing protein [Treponema sp.]|nr:DUF4981 domain-containing protein [Treponema sp.]